MSRGYIRIELADSDDLPPDGPDAATVWARCCTDGVFLRDAASISPRLGTYCLRLAVKDTLDNARIVSALVSALAGSAASC